MNLWACMQALQTICQAADIFEPADVTLLDWDYTNKPKERSPWLVIDAPEEWSSRQDTASESNGMGLPAYLVVAFDKDWPTTMQALIEAIDSLLAHFNDNSTNRRSLGGRSGTNLEEIRTAEPWYPDYESQEDAQDPLAVPMYVVQPIIFEVVEFSV